MDTPEDIFRRDRFAAANGVELLDAAPGRARARLRAGAEHLNALGVVHGGALFTLAAAAFFAACNGAGRVAVGIHLNFACIHSFRGGVLLAEAREAPLAGHTTVCSVRVTDESQALVALFQGTAYVKQQPDGTQ